MPNHLTLAVAGGRKTQGLIEYCNELSVGRKCAIVTFTQTNQQEIRHRMAAQVGDRYNIEVIGWYSFLLRHFAQPFLPFKFAQMRVGGFDFDGHPHRMAKGKSRYMNRKNQVYAGELGRLSFELMQSTPLLVRRLECVYDEILIDEVQDLSGYDWDIISLLLRSRIDIRMVGDVRQSVLSTNPRGQKNKQYAYTSSLDWFQKKEAEGLLEITYSTITYRCRPEIAAFSDTIFDPSWGFPKTTSENNTSTTHDGVFLIHSEHVKAYIGEFQPQCLRYSANSATGFALNFMNFKMSKGATFERVLIVPTKKIADFIQKNEYLLNSTATSLYVAATRAQQSLAIVIDVPGQSPLPIWVPGQAVSVNSPERPNLLSGED